MGTRIYEIQFIYLKLLIIFSIRNIKYFKHITYTPNYLKIEIIKYFFNLKYFKLSKLS